jgi:hypothetical protein
VGDGSDSEELRRDGGEENHESGAYRIISDRHAIAERRSPKPGRDYPVSASDLRRKIASDEDGWRYLEKLRFPRGFLCGPCALRREPERGDDTLSCPVCGHSESITEATIFEGALGDVAPSALLPLLWDEAEGPTALGPEAVALRLGLVDPVRACTLVDRIRAVEAWLTSKPLAAPSDVGLARVQLCGPLRRGERHPIEGWIAVVLARASERLRLRYLGRGQPSELEIALSETVTRDAPLFTHLPRVAAALNERGRSCTLVELGAAESSTRALSQALSAWLALCPEASSELVEGYLAAFSFRNDTRYDPPGSRFYRLASAAMRLSLEQADVAGHLGSASLPG